MKARHWCLQGAVRSTKDGRGRERKRKGGGMSGFYEDLLKRDEERSLQIVKGSLGDSC
jgi:hypothetical protein